MKDSYFRTPRRMDEATFHSWGDPVEPSQEDGAMLAERIMFWIAIGCMAMAAAGWLS